MHISYLYNDDGYDSNDNKDKQSHNTPISCNLIWKEQEKAKKNSKITMSNKNSNYPQCMKKQVDISEIDLPTNFLDQLSSLLDWEMDRVQLVNNPTHLFSLNMKQYL